MHSMLPHGNEAMMIQRDISKDEAEAVLRILVEECDLRHRKEDFVRSIMWPNPHDKYPCHEYRFCGALGFGGKFRNNGNNDNTPYVDCYREDETPDRKRMIERANVRLAQLFGNSQSKPAPS